MRSVGRMEGRFARSLKCEQPCGDRRLPNCFKASLADLKSRPDVRVRNEVPHKTTRECACMFRVLYKPGRLLICYGVEEKDKLDIMLSNPQQLKREWCCYNSAREQG